MIKAIFFDVDGTLLSHKAKRIPHDAEQILMKLKEHGIKIFMSTGRHSAELSKLPVNNIKFDGYITLNGQLCLDGRKHVVSGTPFHQEITDKLVSLFESKKFPLALVEAERIYINFVNDTVCKAQNSISTPVPEIASYENGSLYQATTFFKTHEEPLWEAYLPQGCKFARWSDYGADILSVEGGKVKGIKYFCELYGIRPDEIMAFGDAENDIDMLKYAQIGVAMGNARDCVKQIADYVTTDVDDGGIEKAIQHFQILPENKLSRQETQVLSIAEELLDGQILGIYLYGSATLGRLRPDSDIDILIITSQEISPSVREKLTKELLAVSSRVGCLEKRPLEVTVINQKDIIPWQFPPKCEYMYGEWLRSETEAGKIPQAGSDPDVTILLWQARKCSKALKGPEAENLLPHIPFDEIRKAIKYSLPGLAAGLKGDERNVLLTLSRMWFTLETGEITTKDAAAEWVCPKLPEDLSPLLEIAKEAYLGNLHDKWENSENKTILLADFMRQKVEGFFGVHS